MNLGVKFESANTILSLHIYKYTHTYTHTNLFSGKAGCGGIFRTCRGFIKGCFSLFLGTRLAFEAEIMGFILAIEFAYKFKWKNLWVETDLTYIVALFKDSTISMPWELRNR